MTLGEKIKEVRKQFLVLVTNEFILSRTLLGKQDANKFEIDDTIFTKCTYEVK